jgi:hypothetical protein
MARKPKGTKMARKPRMAIKAKHWDIVNYLAFGDEHFARVRTVASGSYYSLWLCPKCFIKWKHKFEKVEDDIFQGIWKARD